jgi:Uma2 family endonuclease
MSATARKLMTADEFLVWRLDQEGTFELVDGRPVLKFDNGPEMMAGATRNHERVAANVLVALATRLRGGPCRTFGSGLASRMERGNVRQPDVTVECVPGRGDDLETREPKMFVEVLSPSTRRIDLVRKADEYRRSPTLKHVILLEPDQPKALLWSRDVDGDWSVTEVTGLDDALDLSAVGASLPMREIYENVELSPEPQLE